MKSELCTQDPESWTPQGRISKIHGSSNDLGEIMYAIAFDLNTDKLKANYPGAHSNNAYAEIRKFLANHGFSNQQGSLYYGDKSVTQVTAMVAAVELSRSFPYLKNSIEDIRILQLLAADDLMPMIRIGNP